MGVVPWQGSRLREARQSEAGGGKRREEGVAMGCIPRAAECSRLQMAGSCGRAGKMVMMVRVVHRARWH